MHDLNQRLYELVVLRFGGQRVLGRVSSDEHDLIVTDNSTGDRSACKGV